MEPKKKTILEEAAELVSGPRAQAYGTPAENHGRTADLWSAYLGVKVSARDVCMLNVLQKVSRDRHRPGRDNLVDVAGYAENAERIPVRLSQSEVLDAIESLEPPYQWGKRRPFVALGEGNPVVKDPDIERVMRTNEVTAALRLLAGYPVGHSAEANFLAFHKAHGREAFRAYVGAMLQEFAKASYLIRKRPRRAPASKSGTKAGSRRSDRRTSGSRSARPARRP
jgi:hypothetical protein